MSMDTSSPSELKQRSPLPQAISLEEKSDKVCFTSGSTRASLTRSIPQQESSRETLRLSVNTLKTTEHMSSPRTWNTRLQVMPPQAYTSETAAHDSSNRASLLNLFHRLLIRPTSRPQELDSLLPMPHKQLSEPMPTFESACITSPLIAKQCRELQKLLNRNPSNKVNWKKCLGFLWSFIGESAFKSPVPPMQSVCLFGQLIYFADHRPKELGKLIEKQDTFQLQNWLNRSWREKMESLQETLERYDTAIKVSHLQSAELGYIQLHTRLLAKLMMTSTGAINVGIVPLLIEQLRITQHPIASDYKENLMQVLSLLQNTSKIDEQFKSLKLPHQKLKTVRLLLRTLFKIPYSKKIKIGHVREAILAAMMSHMRQGPYGSCFATFWAIELMATETGKCFSDFCELIQHGYLSRKVGDEVKQFPFLLRMNDQALQQKIYLDTAGCLTDPIGQPIAALYSSPGVQAVGLILGIDNMKETIKEFCQNPVRREACLDMRSFFWNFCTFVKTKGSIHKRVAKESREELFQLACFAFCSETYHPLLRAWEYAIAGMAEAEETSLLTRQIIDSLSTILRLKAQDLPVAWFHEHLVSYIVREFLAETTLLYDPGIATLSTYTTSYEGAFVLYHKNHEELVSNYIKIDNPTKFSDLFIHLLDEVFEKIKNEEIEGLTQTKLEAAKLEMKSYICSDFFIKGLVYHYNPHNLLFHDPKIEFPVMRYTPWLSRSGNDPKKVMKVYLEAEKHAREERFRPNSAHHLIKYLIDLGRNLSPEQRQEYELMPQKLYSIGTRNVHVFSLMLGHKTFAPAWKCDEESQAWIEEKIIQPGVEIAETMTPESTRTELMKFIECYVVPAHRLDDFRLYKIPESISITKFRQRLIAILDAIDPRGSDAQMTRHCFIDTHLCRLLPIDLKEKMMSTCVRIADTNWGDSYDVHLGVMINPGSRELELMQIYGDSLVALDQGHWLERQEWVIFHPPGQTRTRSMTL